MRNMNAKANTPIPIKHPAIPPTTAPVLTPPVGTGVPDSEADDLVVEAAALEREIALEEVLTTGGGVTTYD